MIAPARSPQPSGRLWVIRIVFLLAFVVFGARLWQLQIGDLEKYSQMADSNRFRLVTIDPPRGVIYDRNGEILVRNVPSFALAVIPANLPDQPEAIGPLCEHLAETLNHGSALTLASTLGGGPVLAQGEEAPYSEEQIAARIEAIQLRVATGQLAAHSATVLLRGIPREAAFIIAEEQNDMPGIVLQVIPQRDYLHGELTAHWLGYVGAIPSHAVQSYMEQAGMGYEPADQVGLTGVEQSFEAILRGDKGKKHVEVDAFEREMSVLATKPAQPGDNLVLTLDLSLQRATAEALQERIDMTGAQSGSAIAMNPKTGEILAMVSLPSYDNNLFAGGISAADYERLLNDPKTPLLNHAIGGEYPPGSTFKLVPACAALEEGVITPQTTFTCEGMMWLPNAFMPEDMSLAQPFYCWREEGHGRVDLESAVALSCDIYFYQVGGGFLDRFQGLGLQRLGEYARLFGYGAPTGIDLTGEASGLVPTERWKRENWDMNWVTGDTYNISIGQGYILATPLQVLNSAVPIANGGTLYRPQVVKQVLDVDGNVVREFAPEPIRTVPISKTHLDEIRKDMRSCIRWGTGILLELDLPEIHAAGKTGTAEFPGELDEEGHLPTHAWFVGFAPYEDPEIAVVVLLADSGQGAIDSVPVASKMLRHYFQIPEPETTPAT